jgi:hypothetical protein
MRGCVRQGRASRPPEGVAWERGGASIGAGKLQLVEDEEPEFHQVIIMMAEVDQRWAVFFAPLTDRRDRTIKHHAPSLSCIHNFACFLT